MHPSISTTAFCCFVHLNFHSKCSSPAFSLSFSRSLCLCVYVALYAIATKKQTSLRIQSDVKQINSMHRCVSSAMACPWIRNSKRVLSFSLLPLSSSMVLLLLCSFFLHGFLIWACATEYSHCCSFRFDSFRFIFALVCWNIYVIRRVSCPFEKLDIQQCEWLRAQRTISSHHFCWSFFCWSTDNKKWQQFVSESYNFNTACYMFSMWMSWLVGVERLPHGATIHCRISSQNPPPLIAA